MGIFRKLLDRVFDAGPTDDPRRVRVEGKRKGVDVPLVSVPGSRVRVMRNGRGGEVGRFVLWAHRKGVPMELVEGAVDELKVDGQVCSAVEARERV